MPLKKYADVPVGAYIIVQEISTTPVRKLPDGATELIEGRGLASEHPTFDTIVDELELPFFHTRVHEAGHVLWAIRMGAAIYEPDGVIFKPFQPGCGLTTGRWRSHRKAENVVQLSLAGILTQLSVCPDSFKTDFRSAIQHSSIFSASHPYIGKIPKEEQIDMAGSQTDFSLCWNAAGQFADPEKFLLQQEEIVRNHVFTEEYRSQAIGMAQKMEKWILVDGRPHWEEGLFLKTSVSLPVSVLINP